jgi:flagellar L-ring protein precursor FlgH
MNQVTRAVVTVMIGMSVVEATAAPLPAPAMPSPHSPIVGAPAVPLVPDYGSTTGSAPQGAAQAPMVPPQPGAYVVTPLPALPPGAAPSSSLMTRMIATQPLTVGAQGVVRQPNISLFAVSTAEPRLFKEHDLVQIIVREVSQASRGQEVDLEKDWALNAQVNSWPSSSFTDLLQLIIRQGSGNNVPRVNLEAEKDFNGEGDYIRKDNLTDRLTAEVLEVLPNGNLVLQSCTTIQTDKELSTMKVTGICRPDDITPANTLLSNQIFNLKIERLNSGELKKVSEKGIIAQVFDTVFAF